MGSRLGASLDDVRVHTDGEAAQAASRANAHAFTIGSDVFFAAGKFAPHTAEGATRLAHELVHVVQQRGGRRGAEHADPRTAEREASELGRAAASGRHVTVRAIAPQLSVQRDEPADAGATQLSDRSGAVHLRLDPDIERLALQHYVRWWLGTRLVEGEAPTTLPDPTEQKTASVPGVQLPAAFPLASFVVQLPLEQPFFAPLPPDPAFIEPDVGSLYSGFSQRGAPVGEGDSKVLVDIYRRDQAIAAALPDLRAIAPRFLKPLIPLTWRRDIAGALVGADVGARLTRDYMTPIEVSDRAWQAMTGASTTVIPFPSISF